MSAAREVARAVDALRHGWPVTIDGIAFLAIETATDAALAAFDADKPADLVISGNRAAALKLANQRDAVATATVRIRRSGWIDLPNAIAIADPALDLSRPLKGPFATCALGCDAAAGAALRLARAAGLLPAMFVDGVADDTAPRAASAAITAFDLDPAVAIVARARLPNRFAAHAEIVAFRAGDMTEHVALVIGRPAGRPPLVRVHSECLTGDALRSLKCDCGAQLDAALSAIAAEGWGTLLYLRQEGRGVGLVNKIRAYALQDQGFDTVDANVRLGFADDERGFAVAARMLAALAQPEVRLLTNNPRKVAGLEAAGIRVVEQVALKTAPNPFNRDYLDTKRTRSGHQL